jgi:hypothetical protein
MPLVGCVAFLVGGIAWVVGWQSASKALLGVGLLLFFLTDFGVYAALIGALLKGREDTTVEEPPN